MVWVPTSPSETTEVCMCKEMLCDCCVFKESVLTWYVLFADNTASIYTKRNGYSRHETNIYHLPVVISDYGFPMLSSTGTLTIRVCACDHRGNMQSCTAEALSHPTGLSTGALIAILLCIIILLGKDTEHKMWFLPRQWNVQQQKKQNLCVC